MEIKEVASFKAADLKNAGQVFREASRGIVKISRHSERYVLMRETELAQLLSEAADPRPKTLADLLEGYDADAVKARLGSWLTDASVGKEVL